MLKKSERDLGILEINYPIFVYINEVLGNKIFTSKYNLGKEKKWKIIYIFVLIIAMIILTTIVLLQLFKINIISEMLCMYCFLHTEIMIMCIAPTVKKYFFSSSGFDRVFKNFDSIKNGLKVSSKFRKIKITITCFQIFVISLMLGLTIPSTINNGIDSHLFFKLLYLKFNLSFLQLIMWLFVIISRLVEFNCQLLRQFDIYMEENLNVCPYTGFCLEYTMYTDKLVFIEIDALLQVYQKIMENIDLIHSLHNFEVLEYV